MSKPTCKAEVLYNPILSGQRRRNSNATLSVYYDPVPNKPYGFCGPRLLYALIAITSDRIGEGRRGEGGGGIYR